MGDRLVLIANPIATRMAPGLRERAVETLRGHGLEDVLVTEHGGHAAELARHAAHGGAALVVVMGGDGTTNEVAGTLAGSDTALATLPAGSTNVFARALGWPHPADRALPVLVEALTRPTYRTVRLGRVQAGVTDRVFCVNAGVGTDAETVHLVEARPWIKTRFRNVGVGAAAVVTAARGARTPPALSVTVDGAPPFDAAAVIAACGAPFAFFRNRPLDLVPGADFGDRLRWIAVHTSRLASVAAVGVGALRGGRHLDRPDVTDGWAAHAVAVEATHPTALQADGEPLGWHTSVVFSPGPTLRTLVPSAGAQVSHG